MKANDRNVNVSIMISTLSFQRLDKLDSQIKHRSRVAAHRLIEKSDITWQYAKQATGLTSQEDVEQEHVLDLSPTNVTNDGEYVYREESTQSAAEDDYDVHSPNGFDQRRADQRTIGERIVRGLEHVDGHIIVGVIVLNENGCIYFDKDLGGSWRWCARSEIANVRSRHSKWECAFDNHSRAAQRRMGCLDLSVHPAHRGST